MLIFEILDYLILPSTKYRQVAIREINLLNCHKTLFHTKPAFSNFLLDAPPFNQSEFPFTPDKLIENCPNFVLVSVDTLMRSIDFKNIFDFKIKFFYKMP